MSLGHMGGTALISIMIYVCVEKRTGDVIRPRAGRPPSQLPNFHRRIGPITVSHTALLSLRQLFITFQHTHSHTTISPVNHDLPNKSPRVRHTTLT